MKATRIVLLLTVALALSTADSGRASATGSTATASADRDGLARAVAAIQSADYRGDRAELKRQAEAIPTVPTGELAKYWTYWQGFAWWRRAINGFNESPLPPDLGADLAAGAAAFRATLALDPSFDDALSGLSGCLGGLLFTAGKDAEKRQPILEETIRVHDQMQQARADNPRTLWILGGIQLSAPPPWGGDAAKAKTIFLRGLEAARRESLAAAGREPWVPSWGAPELLMALANMHASGAGADREVARAYAEGALSMVPHWSYVGKILLPQIEALPAASAGKAEVQPGAP
jgi:hypothetical protein